jgi:hypothetical protein
LDRVVLALPKAGELRAARAEFKVAAWRLDCAPVLHEGGGGAIIPVDGGAGA